MPTSPRKRTSSKFEIGKHYTKEDIYRTLEVPPERQRGAWDTGYREFGGDLFIFANVGIPGRTGHNYANRWVSNALGGEDLNWQGKTTSSVRQPMVQQLLHPTGEVLVFWRADNEEPYFFAGPARAAHHEDTVPVAVTWTFDEAASPLLEECALAALDAHQRQRPSTGQGIDITAAEARAIERRSMVLAVEHFAADGWSTEDVSRHRPFDLLCRLNDEVLHVEVKGTKTFGEHVLLTPNEVAFAREHTSSMALFVVTRVTTELADGTWVASGGEVRILRPWSPAAENLIPVGYRCFLP